MRVFCNGELTGISIRHFIGYEDGVWRNYYIVYCKERLGTFRVGTSKTLDGAFNIAVNYWNCTIEV